MMIPCLSDVHVHAWREFSVLQPNGVPSRLAHTLLPFDVLRQYMDRHGLMFALMLGDLFHKRNVLHTQAFNMAFDAVHATAIRPGGGRGRLFMIPGNHDQTTKDGTLHSLQPMSVVTPVFTKPTLEVMGDLAFFFLPFIDNPAEVRSILKGIQRPKSCKRFILVGHLGVNGAHAGPYEYTPLEQINASDFPSCFDAVLLGHYHDRQVLQKASPGKPLVMYVGAPIQHSREDSGQRRGIMVFDTDSLKCVLLRVPAPEFVTVEASTLRDPNRLRVCQGQFVTVELDQTLDTGAETFLNAHAAGWVGRAVVQTKQAASRAVVVAPSMTHTQIVKKFVSHNPMQGITEDELALVGLDLLQDT